MSVEQNKRIVRDYFDRMSQGDPTAADLLSADVTWWVPQGSSLGGLYDGKEAVLGLMGQGVDLYAEDPPMQIEVERLVADEEWVCARVEITARTQRGEDYRNQYHFAFRVRDGEICAVEEFVDTKYVHDKLGI